MRCRWRLDLSEGIDFSIYVLGAFERDTVRACQRLVRPGDVVLDIGANIGAHTLPLADLVGDAGRVVAIEPTSTAFAKLKANVALNAELAERIACHQMLLSDSDNPPTQAGVIASWPLTADGDTDAHGGRSWPTSGARIGTLDNFCQSTGTERVDLIKMDVDGAEPAILRGAGETLRRHRPVMIIELAPYALEQSGSTLTDYVKFLYGLGYRLFDQASDKPLPRDPAALAGLIPSGGGVNVIARPA